MDFHQSNFINQKNNFLMEKNMREITFGSQHSQTQQLHNPQQHDIF